MLHDVGALLVLFVVLNALIINEVSTIELEIILLAHSLWLSTIIAAAGQGPILHGHARALCGNQNFSHIHRRDDKLDGVAPVPARRPSAECTFVLSGAPGRTG